MSSRLLLISFRATLLVSCCLLFVAPSSVFADIGGALTLGSWSGGTNNTVFGNVSARLGARCFDCFSASSSSFYVATSTIRMYRTGSPSDYVEGVLFVDGSEVASSSNKVAGSSVPSSAGDVSFVFSPPILISSGGVLSFGVRRTGSYDASNYYRVQRNAVTAHWCFLPSCSENIAGYVNASVTGFAYVPPVAISDGLCEGSDMSTCTAMVASTTEAVYALGMSVQLFLGLFTVFLMGAIGYYFSKPFFP